MSASPELPAKRQAAQLTNGKPKGNNQQLQQLARGSQQQQQQQVAPMNKPISHVNHQMNPMGQNQRDTEIANQISSVINSANVVNENLNNNFLNMQSINNMNPMAQRSNYMNFQPNMLNKRLNQNIMLEQHKQVS